MKKAVLFLILLLVSVDSYAATLVQSTSSYTASSPQAKAFTSNVTAGNMIVIYVQTNNRTDSPTITDSLGNTYTEIVSATSGTGSQSTRSVLAYAKNILGGSNTVTVTWAGDLGFHMAEFSGLDTTEPLISGKFTSGTGSGTSASATSLDISDSSGVIYSGAGQESNTGTNTAGSGYTKITEQTGHNSFDQYQIFSSSGTYTVTATIPSGTWTILAAAFKDAGGGGPPASTSTSLSNITVSQGNSVVTFK